MSFSFPQTKTTSYSNTLNIIFALIFFTCLLIVFNMIANLSTILYIMSVSEQVLSNKILQKGTAACKINSAGDILNIQFTLWLPNSHKESEESEEDCHVQKIQPDTVFFLTGKFAMLPNGSLELVVSSCKNLQIEKDKMPICKPIVYLLGKVKESCNTTDLGYYITIEVKPYLSSELCGPKDIVLTHPIEGRLKNTFTAAKKLSIIQCTGELFILDGKQYCDVIELQFINTRSELASTPTNNPWGISSNDNQRKKSTTENRITAIHQSMQNQPPTPIKIKKEPLTNNKGKSPQTQMKVNEIAREMIKKKRGAPTTNEANEELTSDREEETLQSEEVDLTKESDTAEEGIPQRKRTRRTRKTSNTKL